MTKFGEYFARCVAMRTHVVVPNKAFFLMRNKNKEI